MNSVPDKLPTSVIVDEAANWLALMNSPKFSPADKQAWETWLETSSEHQRIWHSAEQLTKKFATVGPAVGVPVLSRPRQKASRRTMLRSLVAICALPTAIWLGLRINRSTSGTHFQTATGERQDVLLPDGSQLVLNTQSELQIAFDSAQRLIKQLSGEIHIQTAKNSSENRPFIVETMNGRLRALGTRFVVRNEVNLTRLSVLEGAVEIVTNRGSHSAAIGTGQQVTFTSYEIGRISPVNSGVDAWRQGVLYAQNMRLSEFLKELSRYRSGLLSCPPTIADLPVTGAFQIGDTDKILDLLVDTLPVKIDKRTSYWITINPV